MTDHLNVSTTMLTDVGRSLGTLKDEFEHSSNIVDSFHSFHGFIGSGELADALGDFAGVGRRSARSCAACWKNWARSPTPRRRPTTGSTPTWPTRY